MGSISDVADHLFELNRIHSLQSAFFTDDDRFLAGEALPRFLITALRNAQ
jgi:hypothetical protein